MANLDFTAVTAATAIYWFLQINKEGGVWQLWFHQIYSIAITLRAPDERTR